MDRWTSSIIPVREKRRLTLAAELVEAPLQLVALVLGPLRLVHIRELGRLGDLGLMLLLPLGELLRDDRVHVGVGVPRLPLGTASLLGRACCAPTWACRWAPSPLAWACWPSCPAISLTPCPRMSRPCGSAFVTVPLSSSRLGRAGGASIPGDPYPQSPTMRSITSSVGWPRQRRSSSPPSSTVTVGR